MNKYPNIVTAHAVWVLALAAIAMSCNKPPTASDATEAYRIVEIIESVSPRHVEVLTTPRSNGAIVFIYGCVDSDEANEVSNLVETSLDGKIGSSKVELRIYTEPHLESDLPPEIVRHIRD